MTAENLMRSAKAPTISAGVMQAKVIWKHDEDQFGNDDALREGLRHRVTSTPARNILERPPTKALPAVKARL